MTVITVSENDNDGEVGVMDLVGDGAGLGLAMGLPITIHVAGEVDRTCGMDDKVEMSDIEVT